MCSKRNIPICHVEAGLRSFDRTMPEETNRIVTDHLSDLLFTPSEDANINLQNENIDSDKIHFVGNIMIDTLVANLEKSETLWNNKTRQCFPKNYGLVTLHRPSNVDKKEQLFRKYGKFDFVWFDCGGPPEYKDFFSEYWEICSNYVLFHFTYSDGKPNSKLEIILSQMTGDPFRFDIVEPHKRRQGSVTILKKG